jgi:cell division protein FtsN
VDNLDTSRSNAKIVQSTMVEITVIRAVVGFFVRIVARQDMKRNCFKLKKKEARNNNNPSNNNGNSNRQNYEPQDVVFTATLKNGTLIDDI